MSWRPGAEPARKADSRLPTPPLPPTRSWTPPHRPERCHPSRESQIHSRQPGSCGTDSYHGSHSHPPPPLHRKEGSLKACMGPNGRVTQEGCGHSPHPTWLQAHLPVIHSQDVHDDSNGPAVHGASIPLPAYHLRGCKWSVHLLVSIRPGQAWCHSHPLPGMGTPRPPSHSSKAVSRPGPAPPPACPGTRGSHRAL